MRRHYLSALGLLTSASAALIAAPARAAQVQVTLHASRATLLADGKQQTDIFADVRDVNGRAVNGLEVQFQLIGGGTLNQTSVSVFGGVAHTQLTSAALPGNAKITAQVVGGGGAVSNVLDITYTDDPDELFQGSNYVLVTGSAYLAYSAAPTDRIIEAQGKNGTARLAFRNFEVTADRLQLKCDDNNTVRATGNVTLKRGKDIIHAIRLYYSMAQGEGYAIADVNGKLTPVHITTEHLKMDAPVGQIPSSYFLLPDTQTKLVLVARSITYFPGDKLQFRRARFFQDGVQIMALPYYELALRSDELFSDHFISVGSSGLGLEIPFYYNLSPHNSGIVYLRHQEQLGRSYFNTQPGWGLDVLQSYSGQGSARSEGAYGFTNLLQNNWDFRWSHSQEFNSKTQGSFYIDFPHHDSIFSTANLTENLKLIRIGLDASGGDSFAGGGTSLRTSVYAETQPHRVFGAQGLLFTLGTRLTDEHYSGAAAAATTVQTTPLGAPALTPLLSEVSQEATLRTFTRPVALDKQTSLTASFTYGHVWSKSAATGAEGIGELAVNRTVPGGTLSFNYSYRSLPTGLTGFNGKHLLSMGYNVAVAKRLTISVYGSDYLDADSLSVLADAVYRINNNWRFLTAVTLQKYAGQNYKDFEFTLGRRLGSRELQLTYSTYIRRFSFDFTATRW